jgi:hypothetical protein
VLSQDAVLTLTGQGREGAACYYPPCLLEFAVNGELVSLILALQADDEVYRRRRGSVARNYQSDIVAFGILVSLGTLVALLPQAHRYYSPGSVFYTSRLQQTEQCRVNELAMLAVASVLVEHPMALT